MRLVDIELLNENLGNLAQLKVGPLINVLRQRLQTSKRYGADITPIGNKFNSQSNSIGSTSEIIDVGVLKDGLKSLRKAYKQHEGAEAFALYIGGKPVAFGTYDAHTLAGSSRLGRLAFDFREFSDTIENIDAEKNASKPSWHQPRQTKPTTYHEKEPYWDKWSEKPKPTVPDRYYGNVYNTGELVEVFELATEISKRVKQPITAKLVMTDLESLKKRRHRYSNKEIEYGSNDLMTRLHKYKLSKKPSVNDIDQFIKYALDNPGKTVQFAGRTYHLTMSSYDKIEPVSLLNGAAFSVRYKSVDPNTYDSMDITYKYDPQLMTLKPIKAAWYDHSDPNVRYNKQEAVLDGPSYLAATHGIRDLTDKTKVLPKIIAMVRAQKWKEATMAIQALKKSNLGWQEIDLLDQKIKDDSGKS